MSNLPQDFELPMRGKSTKAKSATVEMSSLAPSSNSSAADAENSTNSDQKSQKKYSYPEEELLRVFDEIIFSGEYQETYSLKGRLSVTFKTRTAEELNSIQKTLDSAGYNLVSTLEQMRSLLNLQSALISYHGKDLSMAKKEEREVFINKLSAPVVGMLLEQLNKFDIKVAQACDFGQENF